MIHLQWQHNKPLKRLECIHTEAKKFKVNEKLTAGKTYNVINETDEFYFIFDNSDRIGGFYKHYFKEIE